MQNDRIIVLDFANIDDFGALKRSLYEADDRLSFDPEINVIKREPELIKTALKKYGAAMVYDDQDSSLVLAATFAYKAGHKRIKAQGLKMASLAEIGSSLSRQQGLGRMTVEAITVAEYLAHGHDHIMVAAIQPCNEKSRRLDPVTGRPRGAYAHFEKIVDTDYASKLFEVTRDEPPPPGAKDWHIFTQNTLAHHVAHLLHLRKEGMDTPKGHLHVTFSKIAQERLPIKEMERIAKQTAPFLSVSPLRLVS